MRLSDSSSSFYFSESHLIHDDSLQIFYFDSLDDQYTSGVEDFKSILITKQNGILIQQSSKNLKQNFVCFDYTAKELGPDSFFVAGHSFNNGINGKPSLWFKRGGLENFDSLNTYQLVDTTFTFFSISKSYKIGHHVYIFGGASRSDYPYRQVVVIKHNLINDHYQTVFIPAPASFGGIEDVIYRKTTGKFTFTTYQQIASPNVPYGTGIAKIDTNLVLDLLSVRTLEVDYQTFVSFTIDPDKYHNSALSKVNDSIFLIAGEVLNPFSFVSGGFPNRDKDIAVGKRSFTNVRELGSSSLVGKLDTAENAMSGLLKFDKIDDNKHLLITNEFFYTRIPEPYPVSAALFGFNDNGHKQWEYYYRLNDYCWVFDYKVTSDGGLWLINQCSKTQFPLNGRYDYFIKVAYLDSTVFWPGVLTNVVEPELKSSELKIYPNPVSEQLKIEQYGQIVPLEGLLFNMGGKLIKRIPIKSHQNQFETSQLRPANYILKIIDAEGREVKTEKIVVVE